MGFMNYSMILFEHVLCVCFCMSEVQICVSLMCGIWSVLCAGFSMFFVWDVVNVMRVFVV